MEKPMSNWADPIDAALLGLGRFLRSSDWHGRENELVNLFAHSFLAGSRGPTGAIHAAQLGIEVAVKQLDLPGAKNVVRKDLVLWNKPNETVWVKGAATNVPAAVVEFKVNDNRKCTPDLEWLTAYTSLYPSVLGYSVCGFIEERRGVSFVRISKGTKSAALFAPDDVLPRTVKTDKFVSEPRELPQ